MRSLNAPRISGRRAIVNRLFGTNDIDSSYRCQSSSSSGWSSRRSGCMFATLALPHAGNAPAPTTADYAASGGRRDAAPRAGGGLWAGGAGPGRPPGPEAGAAALERFGSLDIVVANAGAGFGGSAGEVDDGRSSRTLDVNLTGPLRLVRAALPTLLERGGGAVVVVSRGP